jgi:hypothetical protein
MKRTILSVIFIVVAMNLFSQDIEIDSYTPLELSHFEHFFRKDNPSVPLDTLIYSNTRSYSCDKNYYIQRIPGEKKYRVMTSNDKFITEIPFGSVYDKIIWLQNCLVVNGDNEDFNHRIIYVVNLKEGKLFTYKAKGRYYYIGHSDSLCYFYSSMKSVTLGDFFFPEEGTIFSVSERGLTLTDKKEREAEDKIIRKYYNGPFSLVINKDASGKFSYSFHYYDSIWTYNEPVNYFDDQDVFPCNGAFYVNVNSTAIYRFDKENVTKVMDCDTLSIDQFMVENNHLIYSINYDYSKPPLYIMDLDSKETRSPVIFKKP